MAVALTLAILLAGGARAAEQDVFPYPVKTRTLANGLRVVVIPYDSPGIVAYVTVVRTGSRDEVEAGHSGYAHFFEHMMFRGTKKHPQAEYNEILKGMGADSNANTSDDRTLYYIIGPSAKLETMFEVESDRFQNLDYTEPVFRTEAGAILGEYSKNASSPFLPMSEKLRDTAFAQHTYKHTTIGFLADVKNMPNEYEYSRGFFKRFYRPENSILEVVGDVEPEQVFALAEKYYSGWQKGYEAPKVTAEPPPAGGPKSVQLDWPVPTNPYVMIGYRTPAFAPDRDWAAYAVLEQLLFSESAPLYQQLVVDKQWVDFVQGDSDPHRDPYLFSIVARVRSAELVPQVEAAIQQAIADVQSKAVDAARLERTKSHLRYAFATGLDSPRAVAFTAAQMLWLTGDVSDINKWWAQVAQVTPADVQRVAKQTFRDAGRTEVRLAHQEAKEQQDKQPGGSQR